jgi:glycosyltransferase involved in cell wall biosynthesis
MEVAVVIPAYNEAATIAQTVSGACRIVKWVIVVDDGSTDGTASLLDGFPATLLRHDRNQGKAASLWDGMRLSLSLGAAAVVTMDADGQHRPEDISRLIAEAENHKDRIIIAARLKNRSVVPTARRFANWMADFWISWAAGFPIRDTQSGFRLYPTEALRHAGAVCDRRHGFVFESEVLIEAAWRGYYTREVGIDAIYQAGGRPSYYRPAVDTLRIVRMVAWKLISRGLYPMGLARSLGLLPGRGFERGFSRQSNRHDRLQKGARKQ